jgi:hypothetical protein
VNSLRVQTLGMFRVWLNGDLLPNVVWKREKAQPLFQFFITLKLSNSNRLLPKERIVAELWPALDDRIGKRAHQHGDWIQRPHRLMAATGDLLKERLEELNWINAFPTIYAKF